MKGRVPEGKVPALDYIRSLFPMLQNTFSYFTKVLFILRHIIDWNYKSFRSYVDSTGRNFQMLFKNYEAVFSLIIDEI